MKINPFSNKNKKKEDDETQGGKVNPAMYNVHIYEAFGDMGRFIKTIECERYVDEEDRIPYLRNNRENFEEVFPERQISYKNIQSLEQIEEKIHEKEQQLENEKEKEVPSVNFKDLEDEIRNLKNKKYLFKFGSNPRYLTLGKNNKPEFFFARQGSTFFPMAFDFDTGLIAIPTDNKKKSATVALRNKENKYPTNDQKVSGINMMLLFILAILVGVNLFVGWKLLNTYSESEINQIKADMLKSLEKDSKNLNEASRGLKQLIQQMEEDLIIRKNTSTGNITKDKVDKNKQSKTSETLNNLIP